LPQGSPAEPPGATGANSGKADLFNIFGAPMLGASFDLGPLALGAAVFVPFGGRSRWSANEAFIDDENFPQAADGGQRWHNIEGALTYLYSTAGAAYRTGPVSFGASLNLIRCSVLSIRAKNFSGDTLPDVENEGRATVDVSSLQASFGAGVMIEALPDRLWLGASYQAQPGLGAIRHTGTLTIEDRGSIGKQKVAMHEALPDIVRLGARYRPIQELELRLSADLTRWSSAQTTCVGLESAPCVVTSTGADPNGGVVALNLLRAWDDTYGLRTGVSYWFSRELELSAGLGFETAATPDETIDPELPDADNVAIVLGARERLAPSWFLGGSYAHIQYFARDNTGKSVLSVPDVPTRRPDAGGRYEQWIGVLDVNVEAEF
jgi:long-chain fatty acid transport protein